MSKSKRLQVPITTNKVGYDRLRVPKKALAKAKRQRKKDQKQAADLMKESNSLLSRKLSDRFLKRYKRFLKKDTPPKHYLVIPIGAAQKIKEEGGTAFTKYVDTRRDWS